MTASTEELLASLGFTPWRPKSLSPAVDDDDFISARWRAGLLAAIVALHLMLAGWWYLALESRARVSDETILVLDFTELPPAVPTSLPTLPPPPEEDAALDEAPAPTPTQPKPPRKRPPPASASASTARSPQRGAPSEQPLQLYSTDGRLRVPDDMLEQIDRKFGDKRVFSYQIPRMDDAKKYFDRNPPIVYEATRFDQYWKPDTDLLTDLLTQAVEKTTREIRIPVPGNPSSTMVCRISILALGGGCGVLTSGSDYVGPQDDPDTLSPEEDRQCAAWWQQIVGASTQDLWRKTRRLYEAQCRKPLARKPSG